MSNRVSNKITYLYITMAYMIMVLHVVVISSFEDNQLLLIINRFVRILCNMGVPTFFFLSAVLFYRSLDSKNYCDVIIKKLKSLVLPYFSWSIIAMLLKWIKGELPTNLLQILKDILFATNDSVLWFVRVLFVLFLIYPLFKIVLKYKKVFWLIWMMVFAINLYIGPTNGYGGIRYWLPIYMVGAYFGYYHTDMILSNIRGGVTNCYSDYCSYNNDNSCIF